MNSTTPTRQQRDILSNLSQTLGAFQPAASPYPDGQAPRPPERRKNPRALIVAAARVKADPEQVRQADKDPNSERIQELARSIQAVGLQQPPGVRETADGVYEIVYGEGRFVAMTRVLGWQEIEVMRVDAKEEDILWLQLHENIHRTNLSAADLGAAVAQARAQGYSLAQIAERMGKSESYVQKAITIGERLSEDARQVIEQANARPAIEAVYAIAQAPAGEQAAIAREATEKKLNRAETVQLAQAAKKRRPEDEAPKRSGRKKKGKPYEKTLRASGGASVTVKFRKGEVALHELVAVLEEVLQELRRQQGRAAA